MCTDLAPFRYESSSPVHFFSFSLSFSPLFVCFSLFFSFFYKKKSRRSSDKEKSIRSINGKRKRRREGEGGFSIAFPFRSTIWRGKVRKNGCDGGDGTSSVEIPRSPPRPRGTSTTRYVVCAGGGYSEKGGERERENRTCGGCLHRL